MIRASSLTVTYQSGTPLENHALRGLDLSIAEGQFVTVIGSSGSGKSTLLNALAGDVNVAGGTIHIDGRDVTREAAWQRAGSVARVFQDPIAGTFATLSIEENMSLAASRGKRRGLDLALSRRLRQEFRDRLAPLRLGLENRLSERMGNLSGGERQAVSLVMSSLTTARILLLDEPTAALDPSTAAFVLDLATDIVRNNRLTALMVTHSMRQALDYGSRTLMLHDGRLILDVAGTSRADLDLPDLLDLFENTRMTEPAQTG